MASYPNTSYAHQGWLSEDQAYFYLDDEGDEIAGTVPKTRTIVWDVSKLDEPVLVKEFLGTTSATDHNLYVKGNYMYQSNYVAGCASSTSPTRQAPKETGYFDTVPVGENVPGFAGSWSNYPYFKSGTISPHRCARASSCCGTSDGSDAMIRGSYTCPVDRHPCPGAAGARSVAGRVLSPRGRRAARLYVTNQDDATVSVIDVDSRTLIETVDLQKLGFGPTGEAASHAGGGGRVVLVRHADRGGQGAQVRPRRTGSWARSDMEVPGLMALRPERGPADRGAVDERGESAASGWRSSGART